MKKQKKKFDIIETLNEYFKERVGSHELFLDAASLFVLGNAIGRYSEIEYRFEILPINFYTAFVGPTHISRKSTLIRLIRDLCIYQNIPGDITQQALVKELSETDGFGWQYIDELGEVFKEIKSGKSYMRKSYRTYLILSTGAPYEKSTVGDGTVIIEKPCFSLLGATTPASIASAISETDIEGGFLPRFLIPWIEEDEIKNIFSTKTNYRVSRNFLYNTLVKTKVPEKITKEDYDNLVIENEFTLNKMSKSGISEKLIEETRKKMYKDAKKFLTTVGKPIKKKKFYLFPGCMDVLKEFDDEIIETYSGTPMMSFASNYEGYLIKVAAVYAASEDFDYFINNDRIPIRPQNIERARDFIIDCLGNIKKNYVEHLMESKDFNGAYRRVFKALSIGDPLTIEQFHIATNTDIYTSELVFQTLWNRGALKEDTNSNGDKVYYIGLRKPKVIANREKVIGAIRNDNMRTVRSIYRKSKLKKADVESILVSLITEGILEIYDFDGTNDYFKFVDESIEPVHLGVVQNLRENVSEHLESKTIINEVDIEKIVENDLEAKILSDEESRIDEAKKEAEYLKRKKKIQKKSKK